MSVEQSQALAVGRREMVARKDFRLILVGGVALLLLILLSGQLGFLLPLRLVLGFAYILYVPGYCLAAALFPYEEDLDGIERNGLSVGLSIAWIPLLALILDRLPWGLRLWPIVAGELLSILLFAAAAVWRRSRLPSGEAYAPNFAWRPRMWWRLLPPPDRSTYQFIFVALALTVLALAWTFLVPTPDEFMTEFYMLGPEGLAENFPSQAAVGKEIGVTLGLANLERSARTYRVEIWAVDPWTEGRRQLLRAEGPYYLEKGQGGEWPVTWQMPWPGNDQVVDLLLFEGQGTAPYRSLRLWLNVKP